MDYSYWNSLVILFNVIIGVFIYKRMWKYINREMKTAITYSKMDIIKKNVSQIAFAFFTTLTILFIVSFITSTIATNALYALRGAENVDENLILAWQFPTFLPITLIFITAFTFIYPLYEYFLLAQPEKQAIMEIQNFVESNIIQRVRRPWNYLVALSLFFAVVILIPVLLSAYMIYVQEIPRVSEGALSFGWVIGLVFFSWLILGPTIYLAYYAKIGAAHIVFRAKRVDLKKDKRTSIYLIVAIFTIISTIYSFFNYIPILWGNFPKTTKNYAEGQSGAIQEFIELFLQDGDILAWRNFNAILPLDFLLFILTTVVISFIGFYIKFIRKEPLNRSSTVLFATYIFIGIGFTIFLNAMIKWPWVFPDQELYRIGLNIDFDNTIHQEIIVRLFSATILIEKTVNMTFLIYFLFYSPNIKKNADEWVLNRAILENDFDTITKYVKNDDLEIRKMSVQSIISYIKLRDKLDKDVSKEISQVLGDLLIDENDEIAKMVNDNIKEIIKKLWLDKIIETLIKMLNSSNKKEHKEAIVILKQIVNQDKKRAIRAFIRLLSSNLTEDGTRNVLESLQEISISIEGIIDEIIFYYISLEQQKELILEGLLQSVNISINQFINNPKKLDKLLEIIIPLLKSRNPGVLAKAIDVYSTIVAYDLDKVDNLLSDLSNLPDLSRKSLKVIRSKIGAMTKLIIAFPEKFWELFEVFESYLEMNKESNRWTETTKLILNPEELDKEYDRIITKKIPENVINRDKQITEIKSDIALALGSITLNIDEETFSESIFPHLIQLLLNENPEIRGATINSIILIAKTRIDIYEHPSFQLLLGKLLIDENRKIRHKIFHLFQNTDLNQMIIYIIEYLSHDLKFEIRMELINLLTNRTKFITPYVQKLRIIEVLTEQDFSKNELLNTAEFIKHNFEGSSFFNVKFDEEIDQMENIQSIGNISLIDGTLALLYELAIHNEDVYNNHLKFYKDKSSNAGILARIKKVQYQKAKILRDLSENQQESQNIELLNSIILPLVQEISSSNPIIEKELIHFYEQLSEISIFYHKEIFRQCLSLIFDKKKKKNHSPTIIAGYLNILKSIILYEPEYYLNTQTITFVNKSKSKNCIPLDKYVLSTIGKIIATENELLGKNLNDFFRAIFEIEDKRYENIPNQEKDFRELLGEQSYHEKIQQSLLNLLEKTEEIQAKIRLINILIDSPYSVNYEDLSSILLEHIGTKNMKVKEKIIDTLGKILEKYPVLEKKSKPKEFRMFRKILIRGLVIQYSIDIEDNIKMIILKHLISNLEKQPYISIIPKRIREMGLDPNQNIAQWAISAYFKFLKTQKNTKQQNLQLDFLYNFTNNENLHITKIIIEKIIDLYRNGIKLKLLLPALLKLASSASEEVRLEVLKIFEEMYEKQPDEFIFFLDVILKLVENRNIPIRSNAANSLFRFMLRSPDKLQNNVILFRSFRKLALDEDLKIRTTLSKYMQDLVNSFPKRIKEILQILFILIKSGENEIMRNMGFAIKTIINNHPDMKEDIMNNLKRYYKKTQDGILYTLMNEIK